MAIVRCENGHFYDNQKSEKCPFCERRQEGGLDRTVFRFQREENEDKTVAGESLLRENRESVVLEKKTAYQGDDERTVGIYSSMKGNDFVTGWLVCVDGPDRGRDYRLHHGNNKVGRGVHTDVYVANDPKIALKGHCGIVYENKKNLFFLVPEDGNLTYMDGKVLEGARELRTGDCFRIGDSEFEFIAFCRGERRWEEG